MTHRTVNPKPSLILCALGILLANATTISAAQPKHVAVPPHQIHEQQLKNSAEKGAFSHSTMLPISFSSATSKSLSNSTILQEIEQNIYFDNRDGAPLLFLGPDSNNWQLSVTTPLGQEILNERTNRGSQLPTESINMGGQSFTGKRLEMNNAISGHYKITLSREVSSTISSTKLAATDSAPDGYLLFKGDPQFKIYSHLDSNMTLQNKPLSLIAYALDVGNEESQRASLLSKQALNSSITSATVTITTPSKQQLTLALKDDGMNGDRIAGDGKYSSRIPTDEVGVYTSQVQVSGIRPDGIRFSRTVTELYPVESQSYGLKPTAANLALNGGTKATISVPVSRKKDSGSVYLAGELWGTNQLGERQVAAWIGGVVSPAKDASTTTLDIGFDTRWLTRQSLKPPFALKSIRLQSLENNVPIAQLNKLQISLTASTVEELAQRSESNKSTDSEISSVADISLDMLMGTAPVSTEARIKATSTPKLLLVHGYCSGGNTWQTSSFSNSTLFQDYNQNRSHEEFAQLLLGFGAPYSSYGIVAHSQGGAAALHLYSRYWSGLDYATGGRIIQSVGTPYQGTALAGNLAALGSVFGAGCGTNTDLTYSGAANWLATIPSWARAEVDYYTTSFNTKWWRYDYCHLATDLFLDDPEDGTTEKWSGQLSGAVNKGHKKGWCHTSGMRDPAQYSDSSRNSSMNSNAAR